MFIDVDKVKTDGLNNGVIPIFEPGLESLVLSNYAAKRIEFTTDAVHGIASITNS